MGRLSSRHASAGLCCFGELSAREEVYPIMERRMLMKTTLVWLIVLPVVTFAQLTCGWAQSPSEGKKLYVANCSSCHGDTGKGDGIAGRALPAKPADHTNGAFMNALSDKWLFDVISKGGGAVGKSNFMPGWSGALNEKQILDIVAYIRSIAVPPYKTGSAAGK
jgi:cytochrome c553